MASLFTLKHTARATLLAFAVLAALPPAFAQSAGAPPYAGAQQQHGDPPGRVARLNYLSGAVTTEPAGTDTWSYASVNRPLTTGDQLWNDAGARSELHIGSTAVRLGESTSLSVMNLDDTTTQLKVGLGSVSTHVRSLPPGASYEIDTPNLALGIAGPGDYRVDVAPNGASTTVTVRRGSATVYGDNGQLPLSSGQQVVFTGTGLQVAQQSPAPGLDPLDQWASGRDAGEERSVSARYVSRDVPGYQDLDANGTWRDDPSYGAVWVPHDVPDDWAPYHDGHWIWQAPWGWTWVDDAPWGFAPYHYGRWAYVDDSWAWVPGPLIVAEPPVYAPALVAFVGGGGGGFDWSVSLAIGGIAAAGCAWFPLGPGEPWHPSWGGWSPHYYERVNQNIVVNNVNVNKTVNVTNITNINNTYINYRAPHAITAVPANAFVHGEPVARVAQHVDPQQWRNAHVTPGTPGIAPVRQSFTGGLRNAAYQPPAAVAQRPVVATRNPAVPPAYRDLAAAHLAQQGARVPGAGAPVVKTAVPPDYTPRPVHAPGNPQGERWAMRNVQLVNPHGPVVQPARAPGEGQPAGAHGGPSGLAAAGIGAAAAGLGAAAVGMAADAHGRQPPNGEAANGPRVMNGIAPNAPRAQNADAPNAPRFMNGAAPNAPQIPKGAAQQAPAQAAAPERGVPHPPSFGNAREPRGDLRGDVRAAQAAQAAQTAPAPSSPAWMQPHPPIDRQRAAAGPSGAPPSATHPAGQNALLPMRGATQAPHQDATQAPHPDATQAPQGGMPAARQADASAAPRALPQPRADFAAQVPQPRPRPDIAAPAQQTQPRPDYAAPAPRPRPDYSAPAPHQNVAPPHVNEYRPPAPVREAPRPQPQPAMQMQAPRAEPRPQTQMQAPRMEPRPSMPAPRMEPQHVQSSPPPQAQPQPRAQNNPPPQTRHDDRRHE